MSIKAEIKEKYVITLDDRSDFNDLYNLLETADKNFGLTKGMDILLEQMTCLYIDFRLMSSESD